MLRIDKNQKKLVRLAKSTLIEANHWERELQEMIYADPEAFCEEIGEDLLFIAQEISPSDILSDRIDILAVDEAGAAVVIELKRGSKKLQLFQAVSYAGMVSYWPGERFIETLATKNGMSNEDARAAVEEHVGPNISSINGKQRILLIAEDFDPALLIGCEWLHEQFGVDILCYRLVLSHENGNDYITCTCIYPPLEIATVTRAGMNKSGQTPTKWASWDAALESVENTALKDFVQKELEKSQRNHLQTLELYYYINGKFWFSFNVKKEHAYIWQKKRFAGDVDYWKTRLSKPDQVEEKKEKQRLRFYLTTAADFTAFANAMVEFKEKGFSESVDLIPSEDSE